MLKLLWKSNLKFVLKKKHGYMSWYFQISYISLHFPFENRVNCLSDHWTISWNQTSQDALAAANLEFTDEAAVAGSLWHGWEWGHSQISQRSKQEKCTGCIWPSLTQVFEFKVAFACSTRHFATGTLVFCHLFLSSSSELNIDLTATEPSHCGHWNAGQGVFSLISCWSAWLCKQLNQN